MDNKEPVLNEIKLFKEKLESIELMIKNNDVDDVISFLENAFLIWMRPLPAASSFFVIKSRYANSVRSSVKKMCESCKIIKRFGPLVIQCLTHGV
jgi:ribosomal protein L36